MVLRLAGEGYSVVQGLDASGWLRDIQVNDGTPGLKVNQQGSGRTFDFQDGGTSILYAPDGGDVVATRPLDLQQPLRNAGAANGGAVAMDDEVRVAGRIKSFDTLAGSEQLSLWGDWRLVYAKPKAGQVNDPDVPPGSSVWYVMDDGASRQFVVKHKDSGGVVRTGTLNLT